MRTTIFVLLFLGLNALMLAAWFGELVGGTTARAEKYNFYIYETDEKKSRTDFDNFSPGWLIWAGRG